jgi:hypothetical protein
MISLGIHDPFDHEKTYVALIVPDVVDMWRVFCHTNCVHNIRHSAIIRVMQETPKLTDGAKRLLWKTTKMISRTLPHGVPLMTLDEVPMCYRGAKRRKYQRSADDWKSGARFNRKMAKVKCFNKFDKLKISRFKINPAPRMISFRSEKYGVMLATYIKHLEHEIYKLQFHKNYLPFGRVVAKGLSSGRRGKFIHEKFKTFLRPCVISLDVSKFDKHVKREHLMMEHYYYLQSTGVADKTLLRQLLRCQLRNQCSSKHGVKWETRGKRMSGDMNTALGNCLLMITFVITACMELGLTKYSLFDDGDDCLLFIETSDKKRVLRKIVDIFLTYGLSLKVENVAHHMEDIEFCQSKPVMIPTKDGFTYKLVRNPRKVLATATIGTKYVTDEGQNKQYLKALGLGEMYLSQGIPLLQAQASAFIRVHKKALKWWNVDSLKWRLGAELKARGHKTIKQLDPLQIAPMTRVSFMKAFKIDVFQQRRVEKVLDSWRYDTSLSKLPRFPSESTDNSWRPINHDHVVSVLEKNTCY